MVGPRRHEGAVNRGRLIRATCVAVAWSAWPVMGGAGAAPAVSQYRGTLDQYCVTCHNQRLKTAGLTLDTLPVDSIASHPETWEKVVKKLQTRVMPPQGARKPGDATYDSLIAWL